MKITKATNRIFALLLSLALMLTAAPVFAGSDDAEVSDTRELPTGLYVEEEPEIVLPKITDTPGEEIPVKAPPRLRKSGDVVAEGVDKWFSYTLLRNDDGEDTYTIILSPGTSSSTDTPYIYFNKSDIYNEYKDRITRVTVSEGVAKIWDHCFYACDALMSVTLPSTLKIIGQRAFYNCRCLNDINCSAPVADIGNEAFARAGCNASALVNKSGLTAVDEYFAIARMCYPQGSLPPEIEDSDEAKVAQLEASYERAREILTGLGVWSDPAHTDIEKLKLIYDWVTANVAYDYEALEYDKTDKRHKYAATAHSALFKHQAVCSGYVDLTKMMLNEAGIDCVEMTGGNHAWLIVRIDGIWYPVDPTWETIRSDSNYSYFLKSKANFTGHSWEDYTGMVCTVYPVADSDYGVFTTADGFSILSYTDDSVIITKYSGNPDSLTLPETVEHDGNALKVTEIAEGAFGTLNRLRTLEIPEGYTVIGPYAFSNCEDLSSVKLPSTIRKIGANAFAFEGKPEITFNGTIEDLRKIETPDCGLFGRPIKCTDGTYISPKNLQRAKIKLSAKSFNYSGSVRKPKVTVTALDGTVLTEGTDYVLYMENEHSNVPKLVGNYYVTAEGTGDYFGTISADFTIRPQPTKLKRVTAKSKAFTAAWVKRTSQVTGYQIQYALNSKFTKGRKTITVKGAKNVSRTIKKLKGRKVYYVRIRTYKYITKDDYIVVSTWSKVQKVKTKK